MIGDRLLAASKTALPFEVLPVAAIAGALIDHRRSSIASRRAPAAPRSRPCCSPASRSARSRNAGIGFLVFLADDRQLRDITFWLLGSLGGATWGKVVRDRAVRRAAARGLPFIARGLDLIVLGEAEAFHMGVAVERLKRIAIVLVAAATGAAVSVAGVIGFVGIVVPHLLRLVIGPGHRLLLPAALCLGAILLLIADTFARVIAAPAELPIGIVTAAIGAPFFLSLLLRQRALVGMMTPSSRRSGVTLPRRRQDAARRRVARRRAGRIRRAGRPERRRQVDAAARALRRAQAALRRRARSRAAPLASYAPRDLALHRAVLSQSTHVAFPFTVGEVVRMGAGDRHGRAIDDLAERALADVDLAAFGDRIITTLSGGEQQRAHFARVLVQLACGEAAHGPGLLLLDEPTASLDLRHQLDMLDGGRPLRARAASPWWRSCTTSTSRRSPPTASWCSTAAASPPTARRPRP